MNKIALVLLALVLNTNAWAICGLKGSIEARLLDCEKEPTIMPVGWKLVSKTENEKTVWIDSVTGLVWGQIYKSELNFLDAEKKCSESIEENGFIDHLTFRVPNVSDLETAIKHEIMLIKPNLNQTVLTSSAAEGGGIETFDFYAQKPSAIVHPYYYFGPFMCVASTGPASNQ